MYRTKKPTVQELTQKMTTSYLKSQSLRTLEFRKQCQMQAIEQAKYESNVIKTNIICNNNKESGNNIKILENIDNMKIIEKLQTEFYNINFMESIRCIIDMILTKNESESEESLRERIHQFIDKGKGFGAQSANGAAIKTDFKQHNKTLADKNSLNKKDITGMFVMKYPRSPFKSREMDHEVSIGLKGLNKLREYDNYHFSWTYTSIEEGPAVFDDEKNIIGWANQNEIKVKYALYENIDKAKEFKSINNTNDLIQEYLMITLGCLDAYNRTNFTHYDLHNENVLRRHVSDIPIYVKETHRDKDIFIKSNSGNLPVAIDYGMSHITCSDGTDINILSPDGFFSYLGTTRKGNNICDSYKLICMMLNEYAFQINSLPPAPKNNPTQKMYFNRSTFKVNDLMIMCVDILQYFYSNKLEINDVIDIIENQWFNRFHLSDDVLGEYLMNGNQTVFANYWDINEFIDHCINIATDIDPSYVIKDSIPSPILGKDKIGIKFDKNKLLSEVLSNSNTNLNIPNTYDIYSSRGREIFNDYVNILIKNPTACLEAERQYCAKFLSYNTQVTFSALSHKVNDLLLHMKALKVSIDKLYKSIDMLIGIKDRLKMINYCNTLNPIYGELLSQMNEKYLYLYNNIHDYYNHVIDGEQFLYSIIFNEVVGTPNEDDVRLALKNPLYPLYDKYMNTAASFRNIELN